MAGQSAATKCKDFYKQQGYYTPPLITCVASFNLDNSPSQMIASLNRNYNLVIVCLHATVKLQFTSISVQTY